MPSMPPSTRNREQIGARLRFEILRRCNFACYYCGIPAALGVKVLHIDHVIPVDLGGTNDPWNLVSACWDCNAGKTNTPPTPEMVEQVRADHLAMIEGGAGRRTIVCALCHQPYTHDEGDEAYDYCAPCVDRDLAIWTLGYKSATEVI